MDTQRFRVFVLILFLNVYLVSLVLESLAATVQNYAFPPSNFDYPDASSRQAFPPAHFDYPDASGPEATSLHISGTDHKAAVLKQNDVRRTTVRYRQQQPHARTNTTHTQPDPLADEKRKSLTKNDLVDPKTFQVRADVSDMIDFAVIGNPKTGTTFLVEWMNQHKQLYLPPLEMRHLLRLKKGPGLTVHQFFPRYRNKPLGKKLGYKCPADVRELVALRHLRDYFPKTKLIVGIRHPVLWFQSFYNYRMREKRPIPEALDCRGPCRHEHVFACTYSGYFHLFLAQMGRTSRSLEEQKLLRHYDVTNNNTPLPYNLTVLDPPAPHSVFLYDQNQIDGRKYPEIAETFRRDLSAYLGISPLLPSLEEATQKVYENTKAETEKEANERRLIEAKLIDICQPKFADLREELVKVGRDMAEWIVDYYLPLPNVYASSPTFFKKLLEDYRSDPCEQTSR